MISREETRICRRPRAHPIGPDRPIVGAGLSRPGRFEWSYRSRPASPTDVCARLIAQRLSESTGQRFYVENITGAGGNIGTGQAAKAQPDGYTVLITVNSHVINPIMYERVPYDPYRDFDPVTIGSHVRFGARGQPLGAGGDGQGVGLADQSRFGQIQLRLARSSARRHTSSESSFDCPWVLISCTCPMAAAVRRLPRSWPAIRRSLLRLSPRPRRRQGWATAYPCTHEQETDRTCFRRCPPSQRPAIRTSTATAGSAFLFRPERRRRSLPSLHRESREDYRHPEIQDTSRPRSDLSPAGTAPEEFATQ